MADASWRYFTDESRHSFYEAGSDEEARAFAVPFWERIQALVVWGDYTC
jgi:hypothetical protein